MTKLFTALALLFAAAAPAQAFSADQTYSAAVIVTGIKWADDTCGEWFEVDKTIPAMMIKSVGINTKSAEFTRATTRSVADFEEISSLSPIGGPRIGCESVYITLFGPNSSTGKVLSKGGLWLMRRK